MLTLVQRSWLHVQQVGADVVGEILYKKFFELVPESKILFTMEVRNRYKDWSSTEEEDETDLYNSPAMRRLWGKVVNAVGSAVAGLQDINKLVPLLTSLGMRHVGYGIPEEYFEIGGKALALTLKEGLGELYTPDVEHAWTMVYGFISATMVNGLRIRKAEMAASETRDTQSSISSNSIHVARPLLKKASQSPVVGSQVTGGREIYKIERHLHKAIFGHIYVAVGLSSGRTFAFKVLDQETVQGFESPDEIEDDRFCASPLCEVKYESLMEGLDHVMQVLDQFSDHTFHYVVTDLAAGGDLLEALRLRPNGFEEQLAQLLIRQAAKGLANLHLRGLAMQDVSLENMLLHYQQDGEWDVRICGPSQAVLFQVDPCTGAEKPVVFRGFVAKDFRPPELYSGSEYLASKVDAWCLGWSTFYLLTGQQLFQSADPAGLDPDWKLFLRGEASKLLEGKGAVSMLSLQARDFITRLLDTDPHQRMSVKSALWHPWLAERVRQPANMNEHAASTPHVDDKFKGQHLDLDSTEQLSIQSFLRAPHGKLDAMAEKEKPTLLRAHRDTIPDYNSAKVLVPPVEGD
jgi:serine/threonine protein kinase